MLRPKTRVRSSEPDGGSGEQRTVKMERRTELQVGAMSDGRDVRSTVRGPAASARRRASSVRAPLTPCPRAASSTSSMRARRPEGKGNMTNVSIATTSPSTRATNTVFASLASKRCTASRSSGPAVLES